MDAQQITGLAIGGIGIAFVLFRRSFARGVAGYVRRNSPLEISQDDQASFSFIEKLYAVFGAVCVLLGGYVFFS